MAREITILKYHSWYLCQISLQIVLLICSAITYTNHPFLIVHSKQKLPVTLLTCSSWNTSYSYPHYKFLPRVYHVCQNTSQSGGPVALRQKFQAITGDCKLATPISFIRGTSAKKLDSFRLNLVSISFP